MSTIVLTGRVAAAADKTKWELKSGGGISSVGADGRGRTWIEEEVRRLFHFLCPSPCSAYSALVSGQMEFLPWQPRKPRPLAI